MITYQVNILNLKADKLLQDLADLELISIQKSTEDSFLNTVNNLRKKAASNPPTLEEITKKVEVVRAIIMLKQKDRIIIKISILWKTETFN